MQQPTEFFLQLKIDLIQLPSMDMVLFGVQCSKEVGWKRYAPLMF